MKTHLFRYVCCVVALLGLGGNFVSATLVDDAGLSNLAPLDLRFEATSVGTADRSVEAIYPRLIDQLCADISETVEEGESSEDEAASAKTNCPGTAAFAVTAVFEAGTPSTGPPSAHRSAEPARANARPRYLLHRAFLI